TADMVQEISSASKEQKVGMKQLTQAATQQEQVTQLVSANSEELASAAEEMASQSQSLVDLVNSFKLRNESGVNVKRSEIRTKTIKQLPPSTSSLEKKNILPKKEIKTIQKNKTVENDTEDDDNNDFIQL
ncbi:MAG TPA: hypothetical protein PLO89_10770, partial [Spirochaetota bacterium]|nr:hypothetical protein [Spirochaetota bacterium]